MFFCVFCIQNFITLKRYNTTIALQERKCTMENLKKNLANLVKVKTFITLVVIAVFAVLALRGDITPDNVMGVVSTVIAFYFGTQFEKKS